MIYGRGGEEGWVGGERKQRVYFRKEKEDDLKSIQNICMYIYVPII